MTILQAIILGIVQGVGEFLPISSSAHLILVPWFMGWPESGLAFDAALHLGTLAAVTLYFWRDLLSVAKESLTQGTKTPMGKLGWGIAIGTIPAVIVGLTLEERIETVFRQNTFMIAVLLAIMGLVLYLVDLRGAKTRSIEEIRVLDMILMGVGQACALIPGVSRSGSTMIAGLLLGLKRESAAKASFLLGWPVTLGAGILATRHLDPEQMTLSFWVGVAVSAVVGYGVIAFLLDYLRRGTFFVFAAYRVFVAALAIFFMYMRG